MKKILSVLAVCSILLVFVSCNQAQFNELNGVYKTDYNYGYEKITLHRNKAALLTFDGITYTGTYKFTDETTITLSTKNKNYGSEEAEFTVSEDKNILTPLCSIEENVYYIKEG